ncbi:aminoglycoside phosphotransferase family protein, partial [Pirellulales bacterium]|nr:aminoglycoside phosphotransferase family protein [Pirellulales bacterium]
SQPGGDSSFSSDLPPIQLNKSDVIYQKWLNRTDRLRSDRAILDSKAAAQFVKYQRTIESHWLRLMESLEARDLRSVPTQIVHGDISPVNLVFDGKETCSFIDWDCVHLGHRAYDAVGDILNRNSSSHPRGNRFSTDNLVAYLSGYSAALDVPLTRQEQDLIPSFCLARQLEDLRQRMQVLHSLDSKHDEEYSVLIEMRLEIMEQIDLNQRLVYQI